MTVRKSKALTSALRFSPVKKVSKVAVRDRLEVLIDVAFYRHRGAAVPSDVLPRTRDPWLAAEPYLWQMMEMFKERPSWPKPAGDDKLIAEARRGNTEPLARRIKHSIWNGHEFTDELKTFFVELVREMPSPDNRPKSYTAFQHSRRRAWFMASWRGAGDSPEAAYCKAEKKFAASRRTLERAWAQNSDLHNPHWVEFLSENSFTWYFEHLA
jgi:hypothetical protein